MALILPGGPSWAHYTDNLTLGAAFASSGVAVTAAANNTKGSTVTILSALAHDVEYLRIGLHGYRYSSAASATLIDIMVDSAGGTNWNATPLIPDLLAGFTASASEESSAVPGIACWYDFPLLVPAGSSLGARAQTSRTADITTGFVVVQAQGGNRNPASWWCGQRVTAIGPNTSTSQGQQVTLSSSPDFSSWADLGSPLTADAGAVQFGLQGPSGSLVSNTTNYLKFGVAGVQIPPTIVKGFNGTGRCGSCHPVGPIFRNLPAGTQFQVCGSRTSASIFTNDVAVYAVH